MILPELSRVLHLYFAPGVHEVSVLLQEVDALLGVGGDVVVLVLERKLRIQTKCLARLCADL